MMAEADDGLAHLIGCHRHQGDTSSRKWQSFRFWEVVSPRAVLGFRLLIRSASLRADLPAQTRFSRSLCFQKGLWRSFRIFKKKDAVFGLCIFPEQIAFLVFVFSADQFALRLCNFRLLQKSGFFCLRLFHLCGGAAIRPTILQDRPFSPI